MFAFTAMDLSSVNSQLEISCLQLTKQKADTPHAIQQYQMPVRSVICGSALDNRSAEELPLESIENSHSLNKDFEKPKAYPLNKVVEEPKARTIMSVLSNSANKVPVLSALIPPKERVSPVHVASASESVTLSIVSGTSTPPAPASEPHRSPAHLNAPSNMLLNILNSKIKPVLETSAHEVPRPDMEQKVDAVAPQTSVVKDEAPSQAQVSSSATITSNEGDDLSLRISKLEALLQQLVACTTEKAKDGQRKAELKELNKGINRTVEESLKNGLQSKKFTEEVWCSFFLAHVA